VTDLPPLAAAPDQHPTIADLQPSHCRWPIGDPKQPEFHFCGRANDLVHAYCPHHFALATRDTFKRSRTKPRPAPLATPPPVTTIPQPAFQSATA
jgi:hypothetical protein